jgi:prepilin-type N-terminal cleavage/methylation domain-containing protein
MTGTSAVLRRRSHGFTLIEIMAVILILGLAMSLLLPAVGAGGGGSLRKQGERVAGSLELARQRAVVTGKPHRVVIDLTEGSYFIEWLVRPAKAQDAEAPVPLEDTLTGSNGEIDLGPPLGETPDYYPIPNRFGGADWLDDGYFFEGVDTAEGWIEQGEVVVVFEWDGSTDAADILISDPDSRTVLLGVAPLLEQVRIREESS